MHRHAIVVLLNLMLVCLASAHFVYVIPQPDGKTARIVMSEVLTPDLNVKMIAGTTLELRTNGSSQPLKLDAGQPTYFTVTLPGTGARMVLGKTDFGVMKRGDNPPYLLVYYPKALLGDGYAASARVGQDVPVELVPVADGGSFKLQLLAKGKPVADSEVVIITPDGTEKKVATDANGKTAEAFPASGQYGAWARYWEDASGEYQGKQYAQLRHYATLVFDAGAKGTSTPSGAPSAGIALPEPTSSFGATVAGDWLYVYGGHVAPTHSYSTEAVSGHFHRVKLGGSAWETLPDGKPLQGMNLAALDEKIYLVGGMAPRNKKGEMTNNQSIADAARYLPDAKRWEALPPLPGPRSSHDLVVIGSKLYVVGGWNIDGMTETWSDTMAVLDLGAAKPAWKEYPQPFHRRALMAAAFDGKVYVVGGITDKNDIVRTVSIFDPKTETWSEGPELPQGALGFSPAVGVHAGSLYASVADGSLYRLSAGATAWEPVAKLSGRVAHRLVSAGNNVLVLGGASKRQNLDLVEAFDASR